MIQKFGKSPKKEETTEQRSSYDMRIKDIVARKRSSNYIRNTLSDLQRNESLIEDVIHDLSVAEENYCSAAIDVLSRTQRNLKELAVLAGYLKTLEKFTKMLKDAVSEDNFENLLRNISLVLRYLLYQQDELIFRYGDKGDLFYLILKGTCAILIPKDEKVYLSEEEYFLYVLKLKKFRETEILQSCLLRNKGIYKLDEEEFDQFLINTVEEQITLNNIDTSKFLKKFHKTSLLKSKTIMYSPKKNIKPNPQDYLNNQLFQANPIQKYKNILAEEIFDTFHTVLNDNNLGYEKISVENYISRLKPEIRDKDVERKLVTIWNYNHILTLKDGDKFGDFALDSFSQKRSATIIALSEIHLGIMNKKAYGECIKDVVERVNKASKNYILTLPIFTKCNKGAFMEKYFSFIVLKSVNWNDNVVIEGDDAEYTYILKNGEFDVVFNKSINQIDDIIKYYKNGDDSHCIKPESEQLSSNRSKFIKYINDKKYFKIKTVKKFDVIGLNDFIHLNKYLFSVKCSSPNGEVYQIKNKILAQLSNSDKAIKKNLKDYCEKKRKFYLKNLLSIRNTRIEFYKKFNIEDEKYEGNLYNINPAPKDDFVFKPKNKFFNIFTNPITSNGRKSQNSDDDDNKLKTKLKTSTKIFPIPQLENIVKYQNKNFSTLHCEKKEKEKEQIKLTDTLAYTDRNHLVNDKKQVGFEMTVNSGIVSNPNRRSMDSPYYDVSFFSDRNINRMSSTGFNFNLIGNKNNTNTIESLSMKCTNTNKPTESNVKLRTTFTYLPTATAAEDKKVTESGIINSEQSNNKFGFVKDFKDKAISGSVILDKKTIKILNADCDTMVYNTERSSNKRITIDALRTTSSEVKSKSTTKINIVDCLAMDKFNRIYNTADYYSGFFNINSNKNALSYSSKVVNKNKPFLKTNGGGYFKANSVNRNNKNNLILTINGKIK